LRRGSLTFLYAQGDVAAFLRQLGDESIVVTFNTGTQTLRIDIPVDLIEGMKLDEVWTNQTVEVVAGMLREVELAPRSGRVFATARPS
jgi:cyclomaltodextrinase